MYPILIEFGPITVFSLWFFIIVGLMVGALVFTQLAKRQRIRLTSISEHSFALFIWVLIIARVTFILFHLDLYFAETSIASLTRLFAIWDKGLSFWGACLGWIIGILFLTKRAKEDPLKLFDLMLPGVMLGFFFAAVGLFLDGASHGSPTSMPWGVAFRNANVRYVSPVHPTQLYAALYSFGIFLLLMKLHRSLRGKMPGLITEIGVFFFSTSRFFEEFFRGDEVLSLGFVRLPQVAALAIALYTGRRLFLRYKEEDINFEQIKRYYSGIILKFRKAAQKMPRK